MININNYVQSLDSSKLPEMNQLLAKAEPKITFWGNREVCIGEFGGSVSVKALDQKIEQVAENGCHAENLTLQERVAGLDILTKLGKIRTKAEELENRAHWFTKIFIWIRTVLGKLNSLCDLGGGIGGRCTEEYFLAFSEASLKMQFPDLKKKSSGYSEYEHAIETTSNPKLAILLDNAYLHQRAAEKTDSVFKETKF